MTRIANLGTAGEKIGFGRDVLDGRLEARSVVARQSFELDPFACPEFEDFADLVRLEELDAAATKVAVIDTGQFANSSEKPGNRIEPMAQAVDRCRGPSGIAGRKDARAGPRCFLAEFAAIEDFDR